MRSRFWFLVALTAVLVCLSFYSERVFGQPFPFLEGKISGTVTDSSMGMPINNSMVTVGVGSSENKTAATNSTGQYYIGGLEGNLTGITYNVTVSKTGYLTSSKNVTLTTVIDFLPPATQNFVLTQIPNVTSTPPVPELPAETLLLAVVVLTILSGVVFKKRKEGKVSLLN
jgi:uncharacterized membrane protein